MFFILEKIQRIHMFASKDMHSFLTLIIDSYKFTCVKLIPAGLLDTLPM